MVTVTPATATMYALRACLQRVPHARAFHVSSLSPMAVRPRAATQSHWATELRQSSPIVDPQEFRNEAGSSSASPAQPMSYSEGLNESADLIEKMADTNEANAAADAGAGGPGRGSAGAPVIRYKPLVLNSYLDPWDLAKPNRTDIRKRRRNLQKRMGPDAPLAKHYDVFQQLEIDPLHEVMNHALLSHFITPMGKIKPRSQTNLSWKSQKRIGKAIRRARNMGTLPIMGVPQYGDTVKGEFDVTRFRA